MSNWAELDENNVVIRVVVGSNEDVNGDEGYQWLLDNLGGRWVKTSYNATIRGKFAGIGDTYDETLDGFIPPQPEAGWKFYPEFWSWLPDNYAELNIVWNDVPLTPSTPAIVPPTASPEAN